MSSDFPAPNPPHSSATKEIQLEFVLGEITDLNEYREGKDEMSMVEFPIAALSTRVDSSVKTVFFEDTTFDKSTGHHIHRKLTITGSDELGLPTASDDQVLLGLLQLSRIRKFESATLDFSPNQLMQILGWQTHGGNYKRVKESIRRWTGVTFH